MTTTSSRSNEARAFVAAFGRFGEYEKRSFPFSKELKVRSTAGSEGELKLVGNAAVYESPSVVMRSWAGLFTERIARGAFDAVLRSKPDVLLLFNHDPNLVLARTSNGTLELSSNPHGLRYWARAADTSFSRDLRVLMERGDVRQSSFTFSVAQGGESWEVDAAGNVARTITRVGELADVAVVTSAAYPATDSGIARSLAISYALERGYIKTDPAAASRRARLTAEVEAKRRRVTSAR